MVGWLERVGQNLTKFKNEMGADAAKLDCVSHANQPEYYSVSYMHIGAYARLSKPMKSVFCAMCACCLKCDRLVDCFIGLLIGWWGWLVGW